MEYLLDKRIYYNCLVYRLERDTFRTATLLYVSHKLLKGKE